MPNCPTFIVYYFATLKAGGTVVNYNPLYTLEELTFQVKDSETELMVTLDLKLLFDKVEGLMKAGTLKRADRRLLPGPAAGRQVGAVQALQGQGPRPPARSRRWRPTSSPKPTCARTTASTRSRPSIPLNDVAVLQYTGGTTGTPKGAMLTHANVSTNCSRARPGRPNLVAGKERVLAALPFFHVFAMTAVMNFAIAKGAEIVIMPRFVLDDAMKLIDKTKPTVMPGVPTMFIAMLNHPKLASFDLSSLKFCLSGGAPLPVEVKQKFEKLTGCKLVEGYGLSEASPERHLQSARRARSRRARSASRCPAPSSRCATWPIPTQEVPLGEKGEICIKGPQVMKGYWKRPEETANQFVGDYLRTGDVGIMDERGLHLHRRPHQGPHHLLGLQRLSAPHRGGDLRASRRRGGHRHRHQRRVSRRGAEGLHQAQGRRRRPPRTTSASTWRPKISKIEMPAEIEFRDALPKTMIGKLSKKELKAEEEQRRKAKAK